MTEVRFVEGQKEAQLQAVFDAWSSREADGWTVVGAPSWLEAVSESNDRSQWRTAMGYAFTPDVLWRDAGLLVELKFAPKYEPLGLAEVMHHAHVLGSGELLEGSVGPLAVRPVLVTQQNGWNRATIAWMRAAGMQPQSLSYLEVAFLTVDGRSVILLDEPFATLSPCEVPTPVANAASAESLVWRKAQDAEVLTGWHREPETDDDRVRGPRVWAAAFDGGWLIWTGDSWSGEERWSVSSGS